MSSSEAVQGGPCGVNAHLKVPCPVAGMAAGGDSIDDMGVLRHGAMPDLLSGIRAPSTLGSFLRSFTWGNVRQLDAVARRFLAELTGWAPLLPGSDVLAFIGMDSMQKRVCGHARQGAGFGHRQAAWLTMAAICHSLTRAAGALAGGFHARAREATIRSDLIRVAAPIARHRRGHIILHLPEGWHREHEWMNPSEAACGPPAAAA